jgi:hypothetical protein
LKRLSDRDALIESTRANWTSHGLNKEQAEEIANKYSWVTPAPRSSAP